jgi:hypothetical protein
MPIDLLGVGTDPLPGRFQLPTPNRSIGPSEVARGGLKFIIDRSSVRRQCGFPTPTEVTHCACESQALSVLFNGPKSHSAVVLGRRV